eukprot:TRINITY_DN7241_c0_g1_i1.p1 TRINITY_DN7241_c0_g1~~TRINITY_DN7241_c0_g1_i1.p1  ORF type:complete len:342 (+),score=80.20 TRINITY_DN7241_c0_g1_i1:522-1547(+)
MSALQRQKALPQSAPVKQLPAVTSLESLQTGGLRELEDAQRAARDRERVQLEAELTARAKEGQAAIAMDDVNPTESPQADAAVRPTEGESSSSAPSSPPPEADQQARREAQRVLRAAQRQQREAEEQARREALRAKREAEAASQRASAEAARRELDGLLREAAERRTRAAAAAATAEGDALRIADPDFQAVTIAAFPGRVMASPEEAWVLWEVGGYTLLDLRSDAERCQRGHIAISASSSGVIHAPMFLGEAAPNPDWLDDVANQLPKSSGIILVCSDGLSRSLQAINLLSSRGYRRLVLLRGGFDRWDGTFDTDLSVRPPADRAARTATLDPIDWPTWRP